MKKTEKMKRKKPGIQENTEKLPKVSVIVPMFNAESTIERCLDSLLAQDAKDIQIIVVDDGSTDYSPQICEAYSKAFSSIELIRSENGGLCHARNIGLDYAKGDYIGFVDADDWIAKDMYSHLLSLAVEHEADVVSCAYYRVRVGADITAVCDGKTHVFSGAEAISELLERRRLRSYFWNKIFVRAIWDEFRFPVGRTFEGTLLMHRILGGSKKVVVSGFPKYYYVDNAGSIVNSDKIKKLSSQLDAQFDRYIDLRGTEDLRRILARDLIKVANQLHREVHRLRRSTRENFRQYYGVDTEKWRKVIDTVIADCNLNRHDTFSLRSLVTNRNSRTFVASVSYLLVRSIKFIKSRFRSRRRRARKFAGSENSQFSLAKLSALHSIQLRTLQEVVDIFDRNNIEYYAYGGTLLGALRYNGFIPWDDDVDIAVPRDDYERFIKLAPSQLPPGYILQNEMSEPNFPMIFSKVRVDGTHYHEKKWAGNEMHQGVFVDIMPLDRFPKSRILGWVLLRAFNATHKAIAHKKIKYTNMIGFLAALTLRTLPTRIVKKLRSFIIRASNRYSSGDLLCSFGSHYQPLEKRILEAKWFSSGRTLKFEGINLSVPLQAESYLSSIYGDDFLTPPPINDRKVHTDLAQCYFGEVPYRFDPPIGSMDR